MKVFLAGATGVIGRPLIGLLRNAGHAVTGTTRSAAKIPEIEKLGAVGVAVDAFDAEGLKRAVAAAKPDVVIHQLTDLPDVSDPAQMAVVREKNARLRVDGTRNLMAAAFAAGVRRVIAQSIAFIYAPGEGPRKETDPLDSSEAQRASIDGVKALEHAVLSTPGIDGIVLRYGRLYGPGTWFDKPGSAGSLTTGAAAQAALLALTRGAPGVYNIAEDDGAFSVERARRELGFDPFFRL
ncbi:NAD-dependent epimerase/dehydratase family protein [Rhodoplanes sp. Z2-YC6860]|uniref:NAD-dependent epimerase/dehydratase family protein n=1 Tax=Rhodoplanes sp. Z2-YC6860 TaxID=674703 RepID=UPI00078E0976|nr:NAD(P)-dependent oxidoreductase [Rhodoplanes sp. Z2-YC6860]AMN41848.1 dTDP-glucose 4,6-dehydratase [Rhodoplanes sp. Z2-YC6860]